MIAAIYARKSTDQNLPDAEKSVTRQIEHATAYAGRKGWTVDPAHVYQDDGISGAEFVKRPGLVQLMNVLKPHPPFQVLVMSEESRLGRELALEMLEPGTPISVLGRISARSWTPAGGGAERIFTEVVAEQVLVDATLVAPGETAAATAPTPVSRKETSSATRPGGGGRGRRDDEVPF